MQSKKLSDKPLNECQFLAKDCKNEAIYIVELKSGMTVYYCDKHMRLAKANGVVASIEIWKNK